MGKVETRAKGQFGSINPMHLDAAAADADDDEDEIDEDDEDEDEIDSSKRWK